MKNRIVFLLLVIILAFCTREEDLSFDCEELKTGLEDFNIEKVDEVIRSFFTQLTPEPTVKDNTGHKQNLQELTDLMINNCMNISISFDCYQCIKTYPVLSEITFLYDSADVQIKRVLDIVTPEKMELEFIRIHR